MQNRTTTGDRARQWLNLLVLPLAVGFVMGDRPAHNQVATVARESEPLLAAAGWAFAIWGLIFTGQLAYATYQFFPSQAARPLHRRIGWWVVANAVGGALWVQAFTSRHFGLAWLTMLALLVVLGAIDRCLGDDARRGRDFVLVRLPFAINFGWVSVAALLATAQYLSTSLDHAPTPRTELVGSLLVIAAVSGVAALLVLARQNHAFALTVAWGLLGIAAYRHGTSPSLAAVAAGSAALLCTLSASVVLTVRRRRVRRGLSGPPLGWLDGRITHP